MEGELAATEYLRSHGYLIAERNWRNRRHEIDIVALKDGQYHFVEVKTRKADSLTSPAEAITSRKIRFLADAANNYIALHGIDSEAWIDLAAVEVADDGTMNVELIPDVSNLHW